MLSRRTNLLYGLVVTAALTGCNNKVRVEGSTCSVADDCSVNPTCGMRAGGCSCDKGVCYYDPNAAVTEGTVGCRSCHGSLDNPAPPLSLDGGDSTTLLGVGAHQRHLSGGAFSRPVSCAECHLVPVNIDDPGHIDGDGQAEVAFGALSTTKGAPAIWDRDRASCTSYCHGANLTGGTLTVPVWNQVDGTQAVCGTCHGLPPTGSHPQDDQCQNCHSPTAGPNKTIANRYTHIDGIVEGGGSACDSCHGDPARGLPNGAAPPRDLNGNTTSARVGAHLAHLTAANSVDVLCSACHRVPSTYSSPGHVSDADRTAELIFSGLAMTDAGTAPDYAFPTTTCTNTYCHGTTLTGGTRAATGPVWTNTTVESACNSCHGNPPPAPHPQNDACGNCHPGYSKTGPTTGTTTKATHVNGTIDTNVTCSTCHGTAGRTGGVDPMSPAAPPLGTKGETAPTTKAVGAHLAHLNNGTLSKGFSCASCHAVPSKLLHSNGTVDMTFGGLATSAAAVPVWNGTNCATSYCHGKFKNGNPANAPVWTGTTTQAACGTCHGTAADPRPGGNHPPGPAGNCGSCHPNATGTTVDVALHVNGVLDVINLTCTSCHGTDARVGVAGSDPQQNISPPLDANGLTLATSLGVGAHQAHVNPDGGAVAKPFACANCHTMPTTNSHSDGIVQVVFGALAKSQTSAPTWAVDAGSSTGTCANNWCHGGNPLLKGGNKTSIVWNNNTVADCTSCHGNPPPSPHPQLASGGCTPCHAAGYSKLTATTGTVDLNLHVNGTIDLGTLTCTTCHGDGARAAVTGADVNLPASPPVDSLGSSLATSLGVGVHSAHVNPDGGAVARPVACAECHGVSPTSNTHYNGVVEMPFGALAKAQVSTPTWTRATGTCANTWCHGGNAKLVGALKPSIVWNNNSVVDCTSCHGFPPPAPHSPSTNCGACHSATYSRTGATTGTVDLTVHINGLIDVANLTCTSCHGDDARTSVTGADAVQTSAPPMDTLANLLPTSLGVGAHEMHVNPLYVNPVDGGTTTAVAKPFPCAECHGAPPTSTSHSNGVVEMPFGTIAKAQVSAPTWTRGTATCANNWCHGGNTKIVGGTKPSIVWNNGTVTDCTSCHGNPPPLPHAQNDVCATCHPSAYTKTAATKGTVDLAVHVNGLVDLANMTCTSCHGDGTRTSIPGADVSQQASPPKDTLGNVNSTSMGVGQHFAHVNMAAGAVAKPFACAECHGPTPTSTSHSNSVVDMPFGTLAKSQVSTPTWTHATGTCANTWCHGGNAKIVGGTMPAIAWNTNVITDCQSCHGMPPPLPHAQNDACATCHPTAYTKTSLTTGTVDMTLHVNGVVDVANMTCTSCHGDNTRTSVALADANQKASPPADTLGSIAATSLGVGTHLSHVNPGAGAVAKPFTCADCHGPAPTSMSHSDSVVQIAFGTLALSQTSAPTWTRGTATCANNWCHGGNAKLLGGTKTSIVWNNNTLTDCTSCHGNPPPAPHVQNDSCGTCHAGYSKLTATTGTVNLTTHVNGVIDYGALTCTTCHGTVGRTGVDPQIAAAPPSATDGGTSSALRPVGAHMAHLTGTTLRAPMLCTECHAVPTSNLHADGTAQLTFGTLAKTRGAVPFWNGATCANDYCHGAFANGNTTNAPQWTGTNQAACGTCHTLPPGGTHPTLPTPITTCLPCHPGYTPTSVDPLLHVNGIIDGSGEPSTSGTSCATCHATTFAGMTNAAKVSKHFLGGGDNPIDPGTAWVSPMKPSTPYGTASCVSMCHNDHPHTLTTPATTTHQYNLYATAWTAAGRAAAPLTSATRANTDFDPAAAGGGLCLSCHTNAVDASHPGLDAGAYNAAAHDFITNAKGAWTYTLHDTSVFNRNCTKCHADRADSWPNDSSGPLGAVHYSDYPSLLAGTTNPAATPATFICNNCHGNATVGFDYSGKDTATDFAKTQGHPVNADTKHNSVTEATLAYNDGKNSGANRHVNCIDCHDPHEAGATSHNRTATATATRNLIAAGSPIQGVSGVSMTTPPPIWGVPDAGSFTFLPVATAEYQVCFKCHTSFAFGATPPNGPSGQAETDLAQAFNPNNASGHPVTTGLNNYGGSKAPKALVATQLLAPWNVNMGTQTMMCSDCHNTDSVSPATQGPHGSAVTYMLAGPNRQWPTQSGGVTKWDLTNSETSIGTTNGLFCRNCHPVPNTAGSNKMHTAVQGKHSGNTYNDCVSCHILIPHGGKVSRLIVTTNAPARYKGATPIWNKFVKTTNTAYGSANFSSTCSDHSGGAATGEAW